MEISNTFNAVELFDYYPYENLIYLEVNSRLSSIQEKKTDFEKE